MSSVSPVSSVSAVSFVFAVSSVSLCAGSLGRWTASPHSLIVSYY